MVYLCVKCNMEFPTEFSYKEHKQVTHGGYAPDHVGGNQAVQKLPDNVSSPAQVVQQGQSITPALPVITKTTPEPIKLTYKFTGDCPTHLIPVDTLFIEVGKGFMALAYCSACRTNKEQRRVKRL